MIRKKIKIINDTGLHARPASMLAKKASEFEADFFIHKDGKRINGKSILEIMTLAAEQGQELMLEWEGADEEESAESVTELFENGFELDKS